MLDRDFRFLWRALLAGEIKSSPVSKIARQEGLEEVPRETAKPPFYAEVTAALAGGGMGEAGMAVATGGTGEAGTGGAAE